MELTPLRAFREVCRLGSISAAADKLGYTQSAVSRQLATLEAQLGRTLLTRHARGVRPTAAGDVLLTHAAGILAQVDRATADVAAAESRPGPLRVGAFPTASAQLLPKALKCLHRSWPDLRITFTEGVTPTLLPGLVDSTIDLAVVTDYPPGLPAADGLDLIHLLDDRLHVALPVGHRLADQDEIDLAELAKDSWVEDYPGAAAILTSVCARAGFAPRLEIVCGTWLGKQAFVAAGYGVMLAPGLVVPALRPDLVVRPLTDPPTRTVYVATRAADEPCGAVDAFVEALRTSI
ncbi:LysR family transcriptional regulator [Kribbella italica]|uniref:DNA-binding transcriptional LysR family regulator n=1 Tax=Kribbella italica TaxID=1540520 RepID=A0A7W9JDM6_9ACTN|nr:LysR family transcriptional regulator [Kribbella italica]MBB5840221.1 DNA-binding transcriptional LysR family regulator [Kribbella italica]